MSDDDNLSAVLGRAVARFRATRGLRQADIEDAARRLGLNWTRGIVANIEGGRRELSAEELVALPYLLSFVASTPIGLAELLQDEDGKVMLGPDMAVASDVVIDILNGRPTFPFSWDTPAHRASFKAAGDRAAELVDLRDRWWPAQDGHVDLMRVDAAVRSVGEAERALTKRLDVAPEVIAVLAFRLWDRSLAAERDARVAATADPGASPDTLRSLRGHVTRRLIAELRPLIEEAHHDDD